jgi:hypothetical protein
MNEHSGNEGIFAAKLHHLQVPDLQDAIWDQITGMLDAMPADAGRPRQAGKGNIGLSRILGITGISIAVISIILIEKNTRKEEEPKHVPPTHQAVPVDSMGTVPSAAPDSNDSKSINFNDRKVDANGDDSVNELPLQPHVPTGRAIQNESRPIRTGAQFVDSISVLPKDTISGFINPRGVKGISDSAYRIVPGKKG